MAELAAIGLAGNIVQFVDFGFKLSRDFKEIYQSAEGGKAKHLELEDVTTDLECLCQKLQNTTIPATQDSGELRDLARACAKLARELLAMLEKVKVNKERNPRLATFKQALKNIWKDKDISALEERLGRYREQLNQRLVYILSNQQFEVLTAVDNLSAANRQSSTNTEQRLNEIKEELLKQAEKGDGIDYTLLRTLAQAGKGVAKRRNILRSLLFPSYQTRYESIQQAHGQTFDWVFKDSTNNLGEWLRTGGDIYWVQGKAGSGKSTLMRHLSDHPDTSASLKSWAGTERQLVICRHFFWNAGSAMQKSQAGLLQTLLYQVFKECPDLIQSVCPARWSDEDSGYNESWTRDDLFAAFGELSKVTLASTRFCFFVDGLDEYHGDHRDLIALLNKLSESPAFKLYVSSRPWNAFVHAFQTCPQLKLEDLTANDIAAYVRDLFKESDDFRRLQSEDSKCNQIVNEISEKQKACFFGSPSWLLTY